MGIVENRSRIERMIQDLTTAATMASGEDRDSIQDAIAKLEVDKALLAGSQWDSFRLEITGADMQRLQEASVTINDSTTSEKRRVDAVKGIMNVVSKITGFVI